MSSVLSWIILLLIILSAVGLLLAHNWRWLIIFLSIQYLGVFLLTLRHWPLGMATVKLITGWMCATILGMTRSNIPIDDDKESILPQGNLFRLSAVLIIGAIAFSAATSVSAMMADAGFSVSAGSLFLIGMGLLHLGVTDEILRVTVGLLTVLSGFEILYSAVETSVLVAALLAIINLGLALAGSYLTIASNAESSETG